VNAGAGISPLAESASGVHPQAMYKIILVPFDGSAQSARALPVASALAARSGARIQLAIVHDPSAYIPFVPGEVAIPVYDQEVVQAHRARDQQVLDAAIRRLADDGVAAQGVMLDGTIVEAIEEHAQSIGADLIVMTTHGRSGFERLRLGSVASALLTRATVPVLLVRGADDPQAASALPAGPLFTTLDGSTFAEAVLPHARAFAELTGMTLHLVAVTVPRTISMAPFGTEALLADDRALADEEAVREDYLQRTAATLPAGTTVEAITDMSVARGLLDAAKARGAGAVAIATHGRGGFKRFVLGSVADEIVRQADIPVLVYRPTG
jgi:nucleotide-binding universal stress UspA family protein